MATYNYPTGLFSPKSEKLILALRNLINQHWHTAQMHNITENLSTAQRAPDGEVILSSEYRPYGGLWRKNTSEIMKWLAIHMKLAIKHGHANSFWDRSNTTVVTLNWKATKENETGGSLNITVSEIYMVYDMWMGRKNWERHYSKSAILEMIGQRADPITAELEQARRDEIKSLKDNADRAVSELWNKFHDAVEEFKEAKRKETDEKIAQIKKERDQKIAELNNIVAAA